MTTEQVPSPSDLFRIDQRVVILTGASSGLGARFARVLAGAGASVVAAARRKERLDSLVEELGDDRILAVASDITAAGAASDLVAATLDRYGRIDVVVNNAGISRVLDALDDTREDFEYDLTINLVAPYELARHAARWMTETEHPGSIINIGSVLGLGGGGRLRVPGYAAAKGGIVNLTRELASEWARRSIRVNAIAPGWFASEMTSEMLDSDAGRNYITANTPMGRAGEAGELDGALLFLASDASSFVTGQVLAVDGGWTAI